MTTVTQSGITPVNHKREEEKMKLLTSTIILLCMLAQTGHAAVTLDGSEKLSIGAEIASAAYVGTTNVGQSQGVGVIGAYKIDPKIAIQFDMFFSNHVTTYQFWSWYGPYNQLVNSNSVALTAGPIYRASGKKFSPIIGGLVSYQHDYNNIPNPYVYGQRPTYDVDSLYFGPVVGLDYEITRDISIGLDLRYMFNAGSSSNLPAPYDSNLDQNYYMAGVNLKFNF